jgi:hypothetical protein
MDSVGRRFPVMIALRGLPPSRAEAVAEACEDVIYVCLSEGWTADRLVHEVGAMHSAPECDPPVGDCWWTLGGASFTEARLEGRRPRELMRVMLTRSEADA